MPRTTKPSVLRATFALVALAALLAPAARADGPADDASSRDVLAARILEAAQVRMKAQMEEARLLEAAGRREEALAALRAVGTIHEQALAQADAVRQGRVGPAASPPSRAARGRWSAARSRSLPASPPVPFEARRAPAKDPVPAAVAYLLGAQRKDGHFGASAGPADPETTAFCVVALLDATETGASVPLAAARRGAQAIADLGPQDLARTEAGTAPALLAWALASAYARFGEPAWREPLRHLVSQSAFQFAEARTDGPGRERLLRPLGDVNPAEGALAALWILAMLREIEPLEETVPEDGHVAGLRSELEAVTRSLDRTNDAAAAYARDLLRLEAHLPDDAPGVTSDAGTTVVDAFRPLGSWIRGPGTIHDPLALLLGTVYLRLRFGTEDPREGTVWWNRVLLRAVDRQVADGPEQGSWDPGDTRSQAKGRVWTTAVTLLAWRSWDVPWREPMAR